MCSQTTQHTIHRQHSTKPTHHRTGQSSTDVTEHHTWQKGQGGHLWSAWSLAIRPTPDRQLDGLTSSHSQTHNCIPLTRLSLIRALALTHALCHTRMTSLCASHAVEFARTWHCMCTDTIWALHVHQYWPAESSSYTDLCDIVADRSPREAARSPITPLD